MLHCSKEVGAISITFDSFEVR
uniref:Uncharacterized protein n=1 Tax=Rhizophora mucronata TaxID=61149 RepID=A0A2P2NHZ5_RHIMU